MIAAGALLALALANGVEVAPTLTALTQGEGRSGLYGLGLGLELPLVGVATAQGSGAPGVGYLLGGALSWEVTPQIVTRLGLMLSRTSGGTEEVRYRADTPDDTVLAEADVRGMEASLGAAYVFRDLTQLWAPYVGADVALHRLEGEYRLEGEVAEYQTSDAAGTCAPGEPPCRPTSLVTAFGGGVRGGVRLTMARWLQTLAELSVQVVPHKRAPLTHTLTGREVRARRDTEWLVRAAFAVRLGL